MLHKQEVVGSNPSCATNWRVGRAVYCSGFEYRRWLQATREFESFTLRHFDFLQLPMRRIVHVKGHAGDATLGKPYPLFGSYRFLSDLSEAGLPRMASTVLRWAVKHHPFRQSPSPTRPKTRPTAQRYTVDHLPFVCLTPFPVKKMLKKAPQSAFGRCKHLLRAEIWPETRLFLTLMRSFRTPEICSSAFHCSSRRIRRLHNGVP